MSWLDSGNELAFFVAVERLQHNQFAISGHRFSPLERRADFVNLAIPFSSIL
jgi:hypothetical protein